MNFMNKLTSFFCVYSFTQVMNMYGDLVMDSVPDKVRGKKIISGFLGVQGFRMDV